MAKIKVHELAKEIGVKSSDILTELKNRGIEVKNHMSVLEEEQAEDIKKTFNMSDKAKEVTDEAKSVDKTGDTPAKKKKSIIFVSNPQNSKMPGAQIPKKAAHSEKKQTVAKPVAVHENTKTQESVKEMPPVQEKKTETVITESVEKTVADKPLINKPVVEEVKKTEEKIAEETVKTPVAVVEEVKKVSGNEMHIENKVNAEMNKVAETHKYEAQKTENSKPENNKNNNNNNNRNDNHRDNNRNDNSKRHDNQRGDGQKRYDNQRGDGQKRYDNQRGDGQKRDGQRSDNQRNDNRNDGSKRSFDRQGGRPGQGFQGGRDNNNRGGFGGGRAGSRNNSFVPESPIKDAEKHRDEEKRRISQEKDKKNRKDLIYEDDGDMMNIKGKNKPGKFIKPEKKPVEQVEEQIKVIVLPETLTIKELADKMKLQPSAIVKKLFMQGQIVTVNQEITYETAENIAIEYDIICEKEEKVDIIEELLKEEEENAEDMVSRPPVICVMGHVDHGKTSLLDAIRKTNVTDKEAGGITQHIGAYTVNVNSNKITFLDTPGHEAFTAMRMRGANSTDIAILVVAADDGVMPQTVEAINHAKAAEIEIIVAVNKIDKPGANIERVKQELTEHGLIAEDWGGSTVFVPVSAKSGEGIEQLLEMILLTAEMLELKANPNRRARGLVIEAELDKGRGPVATILVQKGTLKVGDFVSAGAASGKVRAMVDDKGRRVKEAGPSTPVEILGLGDVPNAGEIFIAHENDKEAKYYAETFVAQNKEKLLEDTKAKMSLDDLFSQIQAGNLKELNLIIKADVQGSVEAVKQSLMKLSNEEVVVKCIHGGVGAINESDVILASASKAIIIGFNVRPDVMAKTTAEREGVDVRLYKVIYQAIEDIEAAMKGMLDPVFEEKVIGHAEVRQIFKASAVGNIAGSYVLDGIFQRGCKVRITREGEQIYEGELASLKRFKDDVKEVKSGFECGLVFEGFDSMQEFDIVEAYTMVEVPR